MYRDRRTYNYKDHKGEVNSSPSMTVENEAFTIQELYERSAGHLRDSLTRQEVYIDDADHDSIDYNEISKADLTEKSEALEHEIEQDIHQAKKKRKVSQKPKDKQIEDVEEKEVSEEEKSDSENSPS